MKQIFTIIFFLLTIINYSQINWTYEKVQKKYGNENITELKIDENHFQVKKLNETETIKFTYNLENIVTMIEVENTQSIDNDRFHKLAKELNPKFNLTSSGKTENSNFYYDSKNGFLNIKVYKTNKKSEMNKIIFISDPKVITELIPDIKNWK
ncbi:hypothetical protein M8845_16130 [Gelidibacter japonicus]|uniref:hypothetical protein n=1 Tax=Gelidibacter japonicus TaxID=1962232 RepID=UPI0020209242|nr:hypothetical protein [Gelidibacter japonicus]MCL8008960.1 hypothetical protein [Gelidibacter japonicus]